jgi:microcystin-dependent protein
MPKIYVPDNSTIDVTGAKRLEVKSGGPYIPSGVIFPFGGNGAVPVGYVACDGTAYNGTQPQYLALWNTLGVTWGGTGQSSFKVPDFRGRGLIGAGVGPASYQGDTNPVLTARTLGQAKGRETMSAADMPSHTHSASSGNDNADHTHSFSGSGSTTSTGTHSHSIAGDNGGGTTGRPSGSDNNLYLSITTASGDGGHSHSVSVSGTTAGRSAVHQHSITVNAYGGSTADNNMPPVAVVNWIIKL